MSLVVEKSEEIVKPKDENDEKRFVEHEKLKKFVKPYNRDACFKCEKRTIKGIVVQIWKVAKYLVEIYQG